MKYLSLIFVLVVTCFTECLIKKANATIQQTPVTLENGAMIILNNGLVRLGLSREGKLLELSYQGGANLASRGYWNFSGNGYEITGKSKSVFSQLAGQVEIIRQSDDLVEVAFVRSPKEPAFIQTALHYVLRRAESGFYLYMTAAHDASMPPGFMTQYAYSLRLNPQHFDYIAVDETRRHISHTSEAEAQAEKIMDATFRLADKRTVSKYNYTHAIEDDAFNIYGWAGPQNGLWWIQASGEYYGSAPFRVLLTAHQTATTPALVWQAHCTHRGGYDIEFPPGDTTRWEKLYGPAFIYLNTGKSYDAMWNDAKARVKVEQDQWPHKWMSHELFPLQRGVVTGTLHFDNGSPAADVWVIIAPPGTPWSKEHKGYHFWTKTDAYGDFRLEQVRPGRYTLFGVGGDQFYEFKKDDISILANQETMLGTLLWKRIVHGQQIWQLGTADRSTGEFANGNDFHHWGLWRRYPTDFPQDVAFVIGRSTEAQDWNFAHWNWYSQNNAWTIAFDLLEQPKGSAKITFGIAAARGHGVGGFGANTQDTNLSVLANDKEIGTVVVASTGSDSYRSARQSTRYSVREIDFDAALLNQGENIITLRHKLSHAYKLGEVKGESGAGPGCIMYDAIRLEIK